MKTFDSTDYSLLDFGNARRLERFGSVILDRPSPSAASFRPKNPPCWTTATARFVLDSENSSKGDRGIWLNPTGEEIELPLFQVRFASLTFELKGTPFGHLGIFPEQSANWERIGPMSQSSKVLNLFAYTGGSTLAAALFGADVVHLDAAKNILSWSKRNAELSGLQSANIRWIADDAARFVQRELKRGEQYHGIILDPPSYGHGARGEVWRLTKHLPKLIEHCFALLRDHPRFLLLTCHTPQFDAKRLTELIRSIPLCPRKMDIEPLSLTLKAESGGHLPSGEGVFCTF